MEERLKIGRRKDTAQEDTLKALPLRFTRGTSDRTNTFSSSSSNSNSSSINSNTSNTNNTNSKSIYDNSMQSRL